jgi:hypothetical protein
VVRPLEGRAGLAGRVGRWFSPTTLVLVGLCFVLPFLTVSCDTPGGYGRAAPGGTTTYNGVDLAIGGRPDVAPPDRVRPMPAGFDDRLWVPAVTVVLVLLVAGVVLAVTISDRRLRRASLAALAGVAATALLVGQALAQAELTVRVGEQLTGALPAGKSARDYVRTGPGFVLALGLLLIVTVANAVGWVRARPRPALVAPGSDGEADTVRQPLT